MLVIGHSRASAATGGLAIVASGTAEVPEANRTHTIDLPGAPQAGDHVLLILGRDNGISQDIAGYTTHFHPGGSPGIKVFGKTLSAPEATVEVQGDGNNRGTRPGALCIYVLRNVGATALDGGAVATGVVFTATPDPAAIATQTNGALVFAAAVQGNRQGTVSAFPSGYGDALQQRTSDGTSTQGCTLGTAAKLVPAAGAEDPGPFLFDASDAAKAVTFAIRPANAI